MRPDVTSGPHHKGVLSCAVVLRIPESLLLAAVVASSDDALIALDATGAIACWNPAAERMFGYRSAEAVGLPATLVIPDGLERMQNLESDVAAWSTLTQGLDKRGRQLALHVTLSPIRTAEGETAGCLLVARCTPGAAAQPAAPQPENAPRSYAERCSPALAASGVGEWSWDAATDIVSCSAPAAEIFGIPEDTPITWDALRERLQPDDRDRLRVEIEQAVAARGSDYALHYRLVRCGDEERWVSESGRGRYDAFGRLVGMLGVVRDSTRERLLIGAQ